MALIPARLCASATGSKRILSGSLGPLYTLSYRMKGGVEKKGKENEEAIEVTPASVVAFLPPPKPKKRFLRMRWGRKDRGLHRFDGDHVTPGTVLAKQLQLDYHPGQHVAILPDKTLAAMEPGKVIITSEIIDPNWEKEHVQDFYEGRKGQVIFKKFIHVIPDPLPKKFRLVSLI